MFTGVKTTSELYDNYLSYFFELRAEAAFLIKPGVLILICFGLSASGISL